MLVEGEQIILRRVQCTFTNVWLSGPLFFDVFYSDFFSPKTGHNPLTDIRDPQCQIDE